MTTRLPPIMDITGNLDEIKIIMEYNNMRQKCLKDLCELTFLQDFPQTSTEDNLRRVIKYMLDKYIDGTCMINEQPDMLISYTFIFRTEDGYFHEFIFNNHMQFRNDILIICYINQLLFIPKYLKCKVVTAMIFLMAFKYEIDIHSFHPEPHAITFMNISLSYLSISLELFYNSFSNFFDIALLFPNFNLPLMIYSPLIISILPMLKDPPIAILIVIFFTLYETCIPQIAPNIPLIAVYQRILSFFYTRYPEKMKLHLCKRYNIVVLEGDEFKFAPCFAKYRQKAKDLISKARPNDPNLEDILSII